MSYTVFALKWRPKSFDEIIGQSHIVNQLKSAIQKDRLAHAYLFSGPRGVGKTSTARILAKSLNCKEGPTAQPCGKCSACLDIAGGRSLDVIEIDGASNRGIDDIRTLRENVKFSPANGKFKVYIIDEVHQITSDGFNALLKTLEEPPEFVKFIFATTQPNKVPVTILSRCQRLDFRRISALEIISQLEKIIGSEKVKVDKAALFAIARASDGALRDAESILDQLLAFAKDKVSLEDVVSMLGMVEQNILFEITDKIINKDPKGALELLNGIIDKGKDSNTFLSDLIEHFRNLMVTKVSKDPGRLIDLPDDFRGKLLAQAGLLSLEEIFSGYSVLVNAQEAAKRMESLRIPLEISLVRLCLPKNAVVPPAPQQTACQEKPRNQDFSSRKQTRSDGIVLGEPILSSPNVPRLIHSRTSLIGDPNTLAVDSRFRENDKTICPTLRGEKLGNQDSSSAPVVKLQPVVASPVSFEQIAPLWQKIVQNTSEQKISIGNYLREGAPEKLMGNILTISFHKNRSLYKETLERMENRLIVEKIISRVLKANLKVNFIFSQENKEDNASAAHPVIQSAMDTFNARIIKEEEHG